MKSIQLQLTSGGKTIAKMDLPPILQLRLRVYAVNNNVDLIGMIDLALRYATQLPEKDDITLSCPEGGEVEDLAAGLLMEKGEARV